MLSILELFGGIGAPRKSLENIGVDIRSIDYVENLPFAVKAYNSIFNNDYKPQDVTLWNLNVDILIHGSPCVDFSRSGKNDISTGRSIKYVNTLDIIEKELNKKPKVVIWENVPDVLSKRHIMHFNHYINKMEQLGYCNSYSILNSKYYNLPQRRERLFVVSFLGHKKFIFPDNDKENHNIIDYIDFETSFEDNQLSDNEKKLFFYDNGKLYVKEATKIGYKLVEEFDTINVEHPNSKTRRGRVGKKLVSTITTSPRQAIYYNNQIRTLTSKEHLRFMGFDDVDYNNMRNAGLTDRNISYLAGNSIAVTVLDEIFKRILN